MTRLPSRIFTDRTYIVIVIAFSVFMGIVLLTIPQESLRVDRYEMIKLFWDNTLARINPYTPRGIHTNIPGPFPCYFILALPFYLCKEIGLLSLTGFLFFSYLLYRSGASMKSRTIALLLLAGSPAFAWEITCRSTIFLNMVLVVGLIQQMERWSKGGFTARASIGYGLLTGFIACTRSVTILVLVPIFSIYGIITAVHPGRCSTRLRRSARSRYLSYLSSPTPLFFMATILSPYKPQSCRGGRRQLSD